LCFNVAASTMLDMSRAWAAASVSVVLWASAFAAIRAALEGFTAIELSVLRLLVASLALAAGAAVIGLRRPAARDLLAIFAAGATGMTAYQLLLNSGERTVTAGTASLLVSTGPIFVALFASLTLGERLNPRERTGLAVAFAGALVIALGQGGGVALSGGALIVLAAAVSQAAFFVIQKPLLARYSAFEVTAYSMWAGTLLILPLGAGVPAAVVHAGAEPLIAVALLALGASAVGFFTWAFASSRLPVARVSASLYAVPVVAILVALAWLGELPSVASVAGGALALAGVAIAAGYTYRRDPSGGVRSRRGDSRRRRRAVV
jgi:drug/metabolite transporter (DMT)-like permease